MCQGDNFFPFPDFTFLLQVNVFDIYTEVSAFMKWINGTIMSIGGVQACGFTLEKTHTEGLLTKTHIIMKNHCKNHGYNCNDCT